MHAFHRFTTMISLGLFAVCALGQTPIVYPSKGQNAQQQQKDEGECAAWAKQNTGIDPVVLASTQAPAAAPVATAPPPPSGPQGERARGAVRGAAAGAVIGEVANNDAGNGAAVGAATGAVVAGSRARRNKAAQQDQAAQQQQQAAAQNNAAQQQFEADKQQKLATYNRANTACLEGRGYTLK
jgi:YMGG-like Gly-zipper